jgi:hypothetical protein
VVVDHEMPAEEMAQHGGDGNGELN